MDAVLLEACVLISCLLAREQKEAYFMLYLLGITLPVSNQFFAALYTRLRSGRWRGTPVDTQSDESSHLTIKQIGDRETEHGRQTSADMRLNQCRSVSFRSSLAFHATRKGITSHHGQDSFSHADTILAFLLHE